MNCKECNYFRVFGGEMNFIGDCSKIQRTVMTNDQCAMFTDIIYYYVFSVDDPERVLFSSRWIDEIEKYIADTEKKTGVKDNLKYRDTLHSPEYESDDE